MHKDRKTLQQNATFFKKGSVLSFVVNSIIRIENNRFYLPAQGDKITSEVIEITSDLFQITSDVMERSLYIEKTKKG